MMKDIVGKKVDLELKQLGALCELQSFIRVSFWYLGA